MLGGTFVSVNAQHRELQLFADRNFIADILFFLISGNLLSVVFEKHDIITHLTSFMPTTQAKQEVMEVH